MWLISKSLAIAVGLISVQQLAVRQKRLTESELQPLFTLLRTMHQRQGRWAIGDRFGLRLQAQQPLSYLSV